MALTNSRKKSTCGIIGPRLDEKSGWVYVLMPFPTSSVAGGKRRRVNLFKMYDDGGIGVRVRQQNALIRVNRGFLEGFAERLKTKNTPQPE